MWLDHITSSCLLLRGMSSDSSFAIVTCLLDSRSGEIVSSFPGEISAVEPPDPIPNSEVKRSCANGSVGFPCESRTSPGVFIPKKPPTYHRGFFHVLKASMPELPEVQATLQLILPFISAHSISSLIIRNHSLRSFVSDIATRFGLVLIQN